MCIAFVLRLAILFLMTTTNQTVGAQLGMSYSNARPWIETVAVGSTTWNRGRRCVVVAVESEAYAQPMVVVAFADGTTGIYKPGELGLRAGEAVRL